MKTNLTILASIILGVVVLSSCQKFEQSSYYVANDPVYTSYEEHRNAIENDNDRNLEKPGKIFLYNNYILINDYETGVHIYDNSNPSTPTHVAFINIPGNVDIAVKDNLLYVDSYIDLVAIDISSPTSVKEVYRLENAFSYTIPSTMDPNYPVANIDAEKGVVTGYVVREVEEHCENEDCRIYFNNRTQQNDGFWANDMVSEAGTPVLFSGTSTNVRSSASSSNTAIAGSMARFMMIENYLYAVSDENTVKVFDLNSGTISSVTQFKPWSDAGGNGVLETLYTFKNHLFIGSNAGMLAYDVSNPASPRYLSNYNHMTACDPVVANDEYAFVTLRSNNDCNWGNANQLDVLNINDIMSPDLLFSVEMSEPHGLDIDNQSELIFICDGNAGLKVFDFSVIDELPQKMVSQQSGFKTYDIILSNNIAHVIGDGGLRQFSYSGKGALTELSMIPLN